MDLASVAAADTAVVLAVALAVMQAAAVVLAVLATASGTMRSCGGGYGDCVHTKPLCDWTMQLDTRLWQPIEHDLARRCSILPI